MLGATGYTGRLVVERARELGLALRLVGRRREALEQLARDGEEIRVADARHEAELYWEQLKGHGLTMAPLER